MPYIIAQIAEQTETGNAPCLDFNVHCTNAGFVDQFIHYAPPNFWCSVPKGQYLLEISNPNSSPQIAVATVLNDFGGVQLSVTLS
jgi:hypothetical protein